MNNNNEHTKKHTFASILELILLITIVIIIPLYVYFFQKDFISQFKSVDDIVNLLNDNLLISSLIYLGLMVLQIVVSVLPGQVFQMASGYAFGFWYGLLITIAGAALGTAITYYISKLLGKNAVEMIFGKEKIEEYTKKMNSKKAYVIIFLIYLIPGVPKDLMSYAAGISDVRFKPFIILAVLGRIPGVVGSLIIGAMTFQKNYTVVIIVGIIAVILFIIGLIYRKKIMEYVEKAYDLLNK